MNKEEAKNLVVKTFEQSFDESRFLFFIKNLLNDLDETKSQVWAGNYIPESYRGAIKSYKRLGQYTDKNKNVIDILIVNVKRDNTLERARTLQRNFIARHLKQRNHEAALVAFYTEDSEDWRFSLVIMELNLTKTKVEIELSPAKRYSFLVGVNERSHTAQNQFVNLLSDKKDRHTLQEIEEAFNIETVTKEFFLEYRDLFIRTKKYLDKILSVDSKVKSEFEKKGVDSVNFSKKLLGQIVFLYFLQKKGWFGVARDDRWGEGSKKFLRELFESKHGKYNNFYNDILEPLFYEALRIDRSHDDHYYSRFNCKIPFLNGGLFDPIGKDGGYDWVKTDITLPNELFSNTIKTTTGDIGDGILDIFDRYNFTVIEDEPLEKEVAIDPELLGKAYEKFNAIRQDNFDEYLKVLKSGKKGEETKFNKQYGVYYTPREIVHYMCRESLINYLASKFADKSDAYKKIDIEQLDAFGNTARKGQLQLEVEYKSVPHIPKTDIETLINYGELFGENDAVVEAKGKETDNYFYKLPNSIRNNAKLIDEKLADVSICDPAVGSGAFPVGIMHEIISTRNLLSIFIKDVARSKYHFKRVCIEKSLYGSDIDSGAVEIAKLRLWLSLVVDEDDIDNIKPLPNLDYKIICGNSLLNYPYKPIGLDEIENLKHEFIFETNPTKKNELRNRIDSAIYGLYKNSEKSLGYKVTIDFRINFSEVFHKKNGFDIIIGNPPYIVSKGGRYTGSEFSTDVIKYLRNNYITAEQQFNTYTLFIELSKRLLTKEGTAYLIVPNTFLANEYSFRLRDYLTNGCSVYELFNCGLIFESASVETVVIGFGNINSTGLKIRQNMSEYSLLNMKDIISLTDDKKFLIKLDTNKFKIIQKLNQFPKLKEFAKVWRGLTTGDDKKYIVNTKISQNHKPLITGTDIDRYGRLSNQKFVNYIPEKLDRARDERIFLLSEKLVSKFVGVSLTFTYDSDRYYVLNSGCVTELLSKFMSYKYLLSILNSKVLNFYFSNVFTDYRSTFPIMKSGNIENLPIRIIESNDQKLFVDIVEQILSIKRLNNKGDTIHLENQIDIMVYKLYTLTYDEVKIIDPNIGKIKSEEEYEKFEIN